MKYIHLKDYKVSYGSASRALNEYLERHTYSKVFVLVDENSRIHCLPLLQMKVKFELITIASGEDHKNIDTCQSIWTQLAEGRADRHSVLINLGGGVVGDMGGFAASCYMRGIDFIQIPTTLLSQVDASIGGKLGIDFHGLKNFIGLFKNPNEVIIDHLMIDSLPLSQKRSGYAEMIKHALIRDADIFERMLTLGPHNWQQLDWTEEIYQSILIKKDVVEQDPTEQGLRKILNFGHTVGHAVETYSFSTDTPLLHGDAIAMGMVCETILSIECTNLSPQKAKTIINYINLVYPNLPWKLLDAEEEITDLMRSDKKNRGGNILMSLLDNIGSSKYDVQIDIDNIRKCLGQYHRWI